MPHTLFDVRRRFCIADSRPQAYPHLLTTAEVAAYFRVSRRTVRLWAESLELPAIKIGKQWRFRLLDIASLATNNEGLSGSSVKTELSHHTIATTK